MAVYKTAQIVLRMRSHLRHRITSPLNMDDDFPTVCFMLSLGGWIGKCVEMKEKR